MRHYQKLSHKTIQIPIFVIEMTISSLKELIVIISHQIDADSIEAMVDLENLQMALMNTFIFRNEATPNDSAKCFNLSKMLNRQERSPPPSTFFRRFCILFDSARFHTRCERLWLKIICLASNRLWMGRLCASATVAYSTKCISI